MFKYIKRLFVKNKKEPEFEIEEVARMLNISNSDVCQLIYDKKLRYNYYHGSFRVSETQLKECTGKYHYYRGMWTGIR